eukprot:maker-scaffold130_size324016-snap-gene-1.16 protein:Tk07104 transcript:maker-scaffold130_size324016-snap-gene-1.16-mRNA-1 annotation:"predicted protein"
MNSDGNQLAAGSNEKLLPSAPTSASPYPPDIDLDKPTIAEVRMARQQKNMAPPDDAQNNYEIQAVTTLPHTRTEDISRFGTMLLSGISLLLVLVTLPFSLCYCVKVVQEYERAVIFRLGRRAGRPAQAFSSSYPALITIGNYTHSTNLLVATSLRNVLGTKTLAEILSERETICHVMEHILDEATRPWGVKVERVEIKDVRVPVQLQRAMAAEAEAAREARAKVVAAEGEQKASKHLKEAALVLEESTSALQLRYLQTLNAISTEQSSTIVFPFPIDSLSLSMGVGKDKKHK